MGWPRPPGEEHNHVPTKRLESPVECLVCKKTLTFYDLKEKKPNLIRRLFGATTQWTETCPYCGASLGVLLSGEF